MDTGVICESEVNEKKTKNCNSSKMLSKVP